jgi:hypothetical protein
MKRTVSVLLFVVSLIGSSLMLSAQTNTIQLRNGSNTTTILPSASSTITVQIPALSAGTHYLLTSTTNPGSSGAAGSVVTYGATSAQNSLDISATNYLFNVGYAATAVEQAALGGRLVSTATGTNRAATGLTLAATATGSGTATGLSVGATSTSGTTDAIYISSGRLTFLESTGATYTTSFKAGDQNANIAYTLPTADGTSGQFLSTNGSGVLSWATASGGSGQVNFNVTTGTQQLADLGKDLFNVAYSGSGTGVAYGGLISSVAKGNNDATGLTVTVDAASNTKIAKGVMITSASSGAATINYGVDVAASSTGAGTATGVRSVITGAATTNIGFEASASGGTNNYSAKFGDGDVLLSNTGTATALRFAEPSGSGSEYTAFKAQAQAANVTYTLPAADGTSGYYFSTNGSGTLSWAPNSLDNLSDAKLGGTGFTSSLIVGHQTTGTLGAGDPAEANSALGFGTFQSITTGDDNTAVGETALRSMTTAIRNTAVGAKAMRSGTGSENTYVGAYSGGPFVGTTGANNVGVGATTLHDLTSGSNNVAIGHSAGSGVSTGSSNVFIGYSSGPNANVSNKLYIDNSAIGDASLIYGEFDNDIVRLNGRVGIGAAPGAGYELDVVGEVNSSGNMTAPAFNPTSDARLKRNILPLTNALDVVQQLRPVSYEKRADLQSNDYSMKQMGFIAQELESVLPNSVHTGKSADAIKSVDYMSIIPVLTKALQEQQQMINKQQAEIDELRQLIKRMSVR